MNNESEIKNKLSDLNNHLFSALERLNNTDTKGEKLTEEIERSKAINSVAREIVSNANLVLRPTPPLHSMLNLAYHLRCRKLAPPSKTTKLPVAAKKANY